MPHRSNSMHNDAVHAAISTGSGALLFGLTGDVLVLMLWAIYVLILIAIKIPELVEKYSFLRRLFGRGRNEE